MSRKTVFVDEINAKWIASDLPAVARDLIALMPPTAAAPPNAAAVSAEACNAAVSAERQRLAEVAKVPGISLELLISAALEGLTADQASRRVLDAQAAGKLLERKRGADYLACMKADEASLEVPTPDSGGDFTASSEAQHARAGVQLAAKLGMIQR